MDKSPSKDFDDGSCSGIFTLDEVNRLKIMQDVVDRRLTTQMAAQLQGISDRQCRRLLLRYHESGPPGMANRRPGKPSNNQLPDGLAQYALNIIRERYTDFGPTLACEKLAELHDVHLSKDTLIAAGADALELGIPFSDPLADGPTIQTATLRAFAANVTPTLCFEMLANVRQKHPNIPIGLLVYGNFRLSDYPSI